jgi:hypothetical protein
MRKATPSRRPEPKCRYGAGPRARHPAFGARVGFVFDRLVGVLGRPWGRPRQSLVGARSAVATAFQSGLDTLPPRSAFVFSGCIR